MQNSILDRLDKVDYVSNILYQTDIIITAIYIPSSADESASPCLDLGYIHKMAQWKLGYWILDMDCKHEEAMILLATLF